MNYSQYTNIYPPHILHILILLLLHPILIMVQCTRVATRTQFATQMYSIILLLPFVYAFKYIHPTLYSTPSCPHLLLLMLCSAQLSFSRLLACNINIRATLVAGYID